MSIEWAGGEPVPTVQFTLDMDRWNNASAEVLSRLLLFKTLCGVVNVEGEQSKVLLGMQTCERVGNASELREAASVLGSAGLSRLAGLFREAASAGSGE